MKPKTPIVSVVCTILVLCAPQFARAQRLTASDYSRAEQFLYWNTQRLVTGTTVNPTWVEGDRFWYRNRVREGHEFVLVDTARRTRQLAFDHARLAAALSVAADTSYVPNKLPFQEFEYTGGQTSIRFHVADSVQWSCDLTRYICVGPDSTGAKSREEIVSPDGKWIAFERGENLWMRATANGEEVQLSDDGVEHYGYAVVPQGCCQEITNRRAGRKSPPVLSWSPDSRRIATHRYDERNVGELHLLETSIGRPKLHSYRYALPGDSVIPIYDTYVFDVESRTGARIEQEPMLGDFTAGDSVWTGRQWSADGQRLYYPRYNRGFTTLALIEYNVLTGQTRTVFEERGPTLREMAPMIAQSNWRLLPDGQAAVWYSERDGWGHLYHIDVGSGAILNQITSGPWLVYETLAVDGDAGVVFFTAVGKEPGRDPYYRHLYRVGLDGSGLTLLSAEDADHDVRVAPSGDTFVDTYSHRGAAPVTVVRDTQGAVVQVVERADISDLLALGWQPPTPFVAKARDGVTDVYGYLYFPTDFDPTQKYPVIDYVYPGPQIGPIGFRSFSLGGWAGEHALPELGFIVFAVDAIGTPLRSKVFHDGYYGNMGDNGIPDHISALRELAGRYPQMDLDRVGIFGHSGGGFASTRAILQYPDFFKVAASGAGNHDNRGYLHSWAERYQGLLVRDTVAGGDNYENQANQDLAKNLKGRLLLSYGTLDDNVHPNLTWLVIQELIAHNKDFDLMVLPNRNHGYAIEPYAIRRTWDYFVEHLLGAEGPREYTLSGPPR